MGQASKGRHFITSRFSAELVI